MFIHADGDDGQQSTTNALSKALCMIMAHCFDLRAELIYTGKKAHTQKRQCAVFYPSCIRSQARHYPENRLRPPENPFCGDASLCISSGLREQKKNASPESDGDERARNLREDQLLEMFLWSFISPQHDRSKNSKLLKGHLGRIFLCVIQKLSIVPESCGDALALDRHRARPGCTSA